MRENALHRIDIGPWDLREARLSDVYKKRRKELEERLERKIKGALCGLKKASSG